jgi:uncharacterized membrane protein YfcA
VAVSRLDRSALRAGASVCLVFAVPFSLAARWAADSRDDEGLAVLFSLGALVGFVIGSGVAAWTQDRDMPLTHGLITAIGTYIGAQAVFILFRALSGNDIRWYAALFNLAPVLGAGLLGGFLGLALRRRGMLPTTQRGDPT